MHFKNATSVIRVNKKYVTGRSVTFQKFKKYCTQNTSETKSWAYLFHLQFLDTSHTMNHSYEEVEEFLEDSHSCMARI